MAPNPQQCHRRIQIHINAEPADPCRLLTGAHMNPQVVGQRSSAEEKIALFRSLFRGREDVYPRRFESRKTGRAGYAPACANEWVRGICEKPRIKCAECPNRRFLPVTDDVIRWHLSGRDRTGSRSSLASIRCSWTRRASSWPSISTRLAGETTPRVPRDVPAPEVPAALERSRSGRGGHVWLFFEEALPAALATKLGSYILTETMERRPDIGLDSYDRFFPNQDTLPHGGFGNLIALAASEAPPRAGQQRLPRRRLRSVARPMGISLERATRSAERSRGIVHDAERRGAFSACACRRGRRRPSRGPRRRRVADDPPIVGRPALEPRTGPRQPDLHRQGRTHPGLRNRLLRLAAFQNPEFYKAQAMRLPTYAKPRIIACAEDHPQHIGLPRGCLDDVQQTLDRLGIRTVIRDERYAGHPLDVAFHGELRPEQKVAAEAMLEHDTGVLAATTAFGKTVVAAWLIAQRGVNTLVLVHRRQLLDQWVERLSTFLDLRAKSIGRIGGGRNKPTGLLDVAVIQSLVRKGVVDDCVAEYGHVIVDECHHLSAHSFEQVVRRAKARFVLGLSATVTRKDGHHPIIFMQCGPVRHRVDARAQAAARPFEHTCSCGRRRFSRPRAGAPTSESSSSRSTRSWSTTRRGIDASATTSSSRCQRRSPLVLTERNDHLDRLERGAPDKRPSRGRAARRHGQEAAQAMAERLAAIPGDEARVILATGKYIGEGFDDPRLDTLFLTLPVSWRGTIAQYVGRLHRLYDGKREVRVYDYADLNVPMLARMFDRRCRGYEAVGYTVLLAGQRHSGLARRRRAAVGSGLEARLRGQRASARSRRRRYAAREPVRSRGSAGSSGCRRRSTRAKRVRGISLPAPGDVAGDEGAIRCQREVADPVRRRRENGSRSPVC